MSKWWWDTKIFLQYILIGGLSTILGLLIDLEIRTHQQDKEVLWLLNQAGACRIGQGIKVDKDGNVWTCVEPNTWRAVIGKAGGESH